MCKALVLPEVFFKIIQINFFRKQISSTFTITDQYRLAYNKKN
jgi:hypothetical protein